MLRDGLLGRLEDVALIQPTIEPIAVGERWSLLMIGVTAPAATLSYSRVLLFCRFQSVL